MPYADPVRLKEYKAEWHQLNKARMNANARIDYKENKEKYAKLGKQRYQEKKEIITKQNKEWAKKNPEKVKESARKWANDSKNRAKRNVAKSRYRLQKSRTSKFELNNDKNTLKVFALSRKKTIETGRQYHVDHIIPLRGKGVSGFNIAGNLRVVLAHTNISKNDRYTARDEALIQRRMIKDWIANGVKFKLNKPKSKPCLRTVG